MTYRIKPARQVIGFTAALPPKRRGEGKRALAGLAQWRGNILALQGRLTGFYRLRVGGCRYIFAIRPGMVIEVILAAERAVVYQLFEALLHAGELEPLT